MRPRWIRAGFVALLVALSLPAVATAVPTFSDPNFSYQPLVTGLPRPTAAAWTPDGLMLIVTKDGKVFVAAPNGSGPPTLNPTPILDISPRVNAYSDHGLLGIAVDSAYGDQPGDNHYVYLLFTYEQTADTQDTGPKISQLLRVVVNNDNSIGPMKVILGADRSHIPCQTPPTTPLTNTVDCIPSDSNSHSIGTVRADPDGTLWVGSGDGAGYGGVDRTYNENSYAGKILHVDRDGNGLPVIRSARRTATSRAFAPSSMPRAFATRFASRCVATEPARRSLTSAGTPARSWTCSPRSPTRARRAISAGPAGRG